ncbi:MAG: Porphobilinogen synthase, partial [uncultured Corynebacteriales bacterium]
DRAGGLPGGAAAQAAPHPGAPPARHGRPGAPVRPDPADVRQGGDRRPGADRLHAGGRAAHPRLAGEGRVRGGHRGRRRAGALRGAGGQGRPRVGRGRPGRHRPGRAAPAGGRGRRLDGADQRPVPGRVHRPRALRRAAPVRRRGQRRDAGPVRLDRGGPGDRRGARGRPERDDGRPGRRDPGCTGRRRVRRRADPRLLGEVLLGVLRPVPRGGRVRPPVRRPLGVPAGPGPLRRRGPARGRAGHRRGCRRGDGQAGAGVPRRAGSGPCGHRPAGGRLPGLRRVRDGRGGGGQRLDRPGPGHHRDPDRHPPRRRGHDPHLLGHRGRPAPAL